MVGLALFGLSSADLGHPANELADRVLQTVWISWSTEGCKPSI
jgi:hypothetical protein